MTVESCPIIICGVLTVADLEDLRLDSPLPGRLDLLLIMESMTKNCTHSIKTFNLTPDICLKSESSEIR